MTANATQRAIETIFRMERPRLIAFLARMTGDIDQAEELAQEALLVALAQWPGSGLAVASRAFLVLG
jgi:predicted RNA polymerase sigma factor